MWSNSHTCSNNARERQEYFWVCTWVCKIVIPVSYSPFCTLQFCLSKSIVAAAYRHLYAGDSDKNIILKYISKTKEWIWECFWNKTNSDSAECQIHTISLKNLEISVEILAYCMYFILFCYFWLPIFLMLLETIHILISVLLPFCTWFNLK